MSNTASSSPSSSLIQKLAGNWSDKISGINHFLQLISRNNNNNNNSTINDADRISFLQKPSERIRHCSGSSTPSSSLRNILSVFSSNNNTTSPEPRELAIIVKTMKNGNNNIDDDENNDQFELKAQVLENQNNGNGRILPLMLTVNDKLTPGDYYYQEGDIVCGTLLHQKDISFMVITGVVLLNQQQQSSSSSLESFFDETLALLRNQFACLVPGLPLVTSLALNESSSWSRLRMSILNHSFYQQQHSSSSSSTSSSTPRNELSLIEKLLHHSVASSAEKKAALVSDYLLALSTNNNNNNNDTSSLVALFRKQCELLSLASSIFTSDLNDAVVERSGCTVTWWRQKLLFASSPFFVTQVLSAFFLADLVWQKQHKNNNRNNNNSGMMVKEIELEEMIEFFDGLLLKMISNVGKHVERVLSLTFPSSSAAGIDLSFVGPLGLVSLCEETAETLSVISLVLKSWKDLVGASSSSSSLGVTSHQQTNEEDDSTTNSSPSSRVSHHQVSVTSSEDPQIELPSHIEGDPIKEETYVRQVASDLFLIAPTTITRTQLCVVDAILRGTESVVEYVARVVSSLSSSSSSEQQNSNSSSSLWFISQLPTIPDHEIGAHSVSEQLLRLQVTLLDKIHTQSLKEAEDTNSLVNEKFAKVWQQQQQAMKLLTSNATVHQNQQQQLQLLNSLSSKLESTINQILNTTNSNSSFSSSSHQTANSAAATATTKMVGRLCVLKMLRMVSHLLLKERVLSIGYRRELSSLILDDDMSSSLNNSSDLKNKNKGSESTCSFSAVFEPHCVGSWVESDLNSSVLSRSSPKVSILRDATSEFNGRLVLHGRRVLSKDFSSSSTHQQQPSLGVLVVCAADQNMWLLWFTVAAVLPLRSNQNQDEQSQQQQQEEEEEEEVALVINLLHQEASLVQALLGAAEMSKQDLLENQHQVQSHDQFAGSFCLFFNADNKNDSAASNWIASVTSQAHSNVSNIIGKSSSASSFNSLLRPLPHKQPIQHQFSNQQQQTSAEEGQDENDDNETEQDFISRTVTETLKLFEDEFSLSSEQKKVVEHSVLASVGEDQNSSSFSSSNVVCAQGFARCGKSTTLTQTAAIRAKTIQALTSFRLNNKTNVSVPNANEFKSKMMVMTSSSSATTTTSSNDQQQQQESLAVKMMMMEEDESSSGSSPSEIRNQFLQDLCHFHHQLELDSPTLFVCQGSEVARRRSEQMYHKLFMMTGSSSAHSKNANPENNLETKSLLPFRLSHHFNSALTRCNKSPFIQKLLKQQREEIISQLRKISFTLATSVDENNDHDNSEDEGGAQRLTQKQLFSDSRLKQILSPSQMKCLLQMRKIMKSASDSTSITTARIYPMNRELFHKIFSFSLLEEEDDSSSTNFFFDEDLASEIQSFSTTHGFGITILPLQALDYSSSSAMMSNQNTNTHQLTSDISLLSRLDFSKHNLSITDDLQSSIMNALKSRCLSLIKKEQEELFSKLLTINAMMRDVVESTTAQSIKSQPGRVLVVDSERDLLDFRFGFFLLSPFRLPVRSVIVDDAEKILGSCSSSPLVSSSSLLFRSLLENNTDRGLWASGMATTTSSSSSKRRKQHRKQNNKTVFTLSFDPSLVVETLKLVARNDHRASQHHQQNSSSSRRSTTIQHHSSSTLLPLVNFSLSSSHRLLLSSVLHSLLKNRIGSMIKNLSSSEQQSTPSDDASSSSVIKHVDLTDEEIISKSTNFYLNYLRRIICNSGAYSSSTEGEQSSSSSLKEPTKDQMIVTKDTTTILSRSLARNISLWSIPLPSFDSSSSSSSTSIKNLEEEERLNSRRQDIATKIFFKCLNEAFQTISNLIDGGNDKNDHSNNNSSSSTNSGIAFVAENGNLLSIASSPNMTKLPSLLTNKKSQSLTIYSEIESVSSATIDSLFLIIVPNFVLAQKNRHVTVSSSSTNTPLASLLLSTSSTPQMKDLFAETLTFISSPSSDSTSASQLLLRVSGSLLCLSSSAIFDRALHDQNNIIISHAETQLNQAEQANAGNKLVASSSSMMMNGNTNNFLASFSSSSTSSSSTSPLWIRQLVQSANYSRAPTYLSSSNTPQEKTNLISDADSMFYGGGGEDFHSAAASLVFAKNRHNNEELLKIVQDSLLKKSHGPALEVCCPRHQQQVRGFLLFSVDSDFFIINSSISNESDRSKNEELENQRLRKEQEEIEKMNELIASTQFIQRLLPRHQEQQQQTEEDAVATDKTTRNCSGLFGRCQLACLSKYERCSVRSHMCLEQCHELSSCCDGNKNNKNNNKFHLSHPTPCPFLCNKKLPCTHSCAQDCGAPVCQCPFSEMPVVVVERNCGEHCIVGVDSTPEKNPHSQFYKHTIIIPCNGMNPEMIDVERDLPPCQEPVQVACERCQTIISCLCCDVDTFRQDGLSTNPVLCNLCRDEEENNTSGRDLQKVIMKNKLLAKRTGLLAAAAPKDENGHSTDARVQRILKRREELVQQSEVALKNAMEVAKKRMMSDVMKAKDTFRRQEQLLSDLNAHRIQFMNVIRRNV